MDFLVTIIILPCHDVHLVMKSLLMFAVLPIPYIWLQIIPATDFIKRKHRYILISKVRNRLSQEELLQKCHYKNFCCTTFSDSKKSMKNGHFSLIIIILLIIVLCTKKWLNAMTRCTNCQLANDVSVSIHFYKYDKQKYFRFDR